mgnify:CR=1 FL=1|jgi:hypothetical protein
MCILKEVGVAAVESANVRGAEAVELGVDPLGREGWSLLVGPFYI